MGTTWQRWTGTTFFIEARLYPQIPMSDYVDVAHTQKAVATPKEPTQQEREHHELIHFPIAI
eukprot:7218630-Lingulodinium_polyedra.AAC.1